MNAWLITLDGTDASIGEGRRLVAILPGNQTDAYVTGFLGHVYLMMTANGADMMHAARRRSRW